MMRANSREFMYKCANNRIVSIENRNRLWIVEKLFLFNFEVEFYFKLVINVLSR